MAWFLWFSRKLAVSKGLCRKLDFATLFDDIYIVLTTRFNYTRGSIQGRTRSLTGELFKMINRVIDVRYGNFLVIIIAAYPFGTSNTSGNVWSPTTTCGDVFGISVNVVSSWRIADIDDENIMSRGGDKSIIFGYF